MTSTPESHIRFKFRLAARTEGRATWWGRFRWLWLLAAIGIEAGMATGPASWGTGRMLDSWSFQSLCLLAGWVPVWLCADLFATRYRGNPDPLREWRPVEFLARAAGRLCLFYSCLLIWVVTFTGRVLVNDLRPPAGGASGLVQSWSQFPEAWLFWTLVILASSLARAASAALLSATSRRPRRWLVLLILLAVGTVADFGGSLLIYAPFATTRLQLSVQNLATCAATPNLWLGYSLAVWTDRLLRLSAPRMMGGDATFSDICLIATLYFGVFTLGAGWLLKYVAERRRRRNPDTREAE